MDTEFGMLLVHTRRWQQVSYCSYTLETPAVACPTNTEPSCHHPNQVSHCINPLIIH
jgi:hypothetical protein